MVSAYLPATFAHVRFLAGMNAGVYRQRRSLDELLIATGIVADMRSNTTVYTFYTQSQRKINRFRVKFVPCRARSLRRANPLPHVLHANAF